ncbi:MAG: DUF721 domain-containing protein [Lentisphaeria bacterium]|nr:DUF721 domain-containing protein [Lentisphaeria bacterium]
MFGKDDIDAPLASKRHFPSSTERALDELVADFVGEESAPEVHMKLRRPARQISESVNRFLLRIHQDSEVLLSELTLHWTELAGAETSLQVKPKSVRGKTLVVSALNQTYVFLFRDPKFRDPILEKIKMFTDGRIESIRVVTAGW